MQGIIKNFTLGAIFLLLFQVFLPMSMFAQCTKKSCDEVRQIMKKQEMAWSEGNVEGFMEGYWQSDSLKFIGKRGLTYGWQNTLDNYKKSYPDPAAMGKLTFELLMVEKTGRNSIYVIGKWRLDREKDILEGHFTLLWKKMKGDWVIVADHSS